MRYCRMRSLALALLLAGPAAAQDVQSWTTLVAQGPVDGNLLLWAETQTRMIGDVSRLGLVSGRIGLGVRLKPGVDLFGGYHYQVSYPQPDRTISEHRFWQQLQAQLLRQPNGLTLTTRLRLEERMIENARDLGWRLRVQLRLAQPLHGPGSGGPVVAAETLMALNSTDWGARAGLSQQRMLAGWSQPLSPRLNLEADYQHVELYRPGPNLVNHVISVTLTRRLG